jgi:hypothetical protein
VVLHLFTLVLNGMPFIRHHESVLRGLGVPWRWRIVEGVAELRADTAWSLKNGGRFPFIMTKNGLSTDGTTSYLNRLQRLHPRQIKIVRKKCGNPWPGKVAMVRAGMTGIRDGDLLLQLDSDELWTRSNLEGLVKTFRTRSELQWARVPCRFFYGPALYATGENQYGNNQSEWLRVWRYQRGDHWQSHEPPCLIRRNTNRPVTEESGLERKESRALGCEFDHYAYATEKQVIFKESYYGYSGAAHQWRFMQNNAPVGALIRRYLSWVRELEISKSRNLRGYLQRWFEPLAPGARLKRLGPTELRVAFQKPNGLWKFSPERKAP